MAVGVAVGVEPQAEMAANIKATVAANWYDVRTLSACAAKLSRYSPAILSRYPRTIA